MEQATGLTVMPSPWTSKVTMEESCSSCSAKKRRKGDHHQRPQRREQEQMSGMAAAAAGITGIIDPDVLDCTICFDPLRPPVFQCAVGHVICSSCHSSLPNKDKCHTCSHTGGYHRCNALDKILESFHVPCANAAYGCTTKTHYHDVEEHHKSCPHAPCFCPEPGCGFNGGSTIKLLDHLTSGHMWPSTELEYNVKLTLQVKAGAHVLHSRDGGPLFLVKFTPVPPYGNAASVLCIDPDATATTEKGRRFRCHLGSSNVDMDWQQSSRFQVRSTTLSDGWPPTEDGGSLYVAPSTECITVSVTKIMRDMRGNEIQLTPIRMRQSTLCQCFESRGSC